MYLLVFRSKPYIKIIITQSAFSWITSPAFTIIGIMNKFIVLRCPPGIENLMKYTEKYKVKQFYM